MWFNPIMTWLLRSPLHAFVSKNMMLITYTGRKSGKTYTTPVNYVRIDSDRGSYLLTTSFSQRTWWRNLRGGAPVSLMLQGKAVQATATLVEDEQGVIDDLRALVLGSPQYARYLEVSTSPDGAPDAQALARAAKDRITVRTFLPGRGE
ncbi:MAG: nitroreductase family deazaflavin-dependent oxidoreductase [Chloroflexota bacterium]